MPVTRPTLFIALLSLLAAFQTATAQIRPAPAPPVIGAKSYLVIDSTTGHEIASLKPDSRLAPASLTKLMTAYVVFHSLQEEQVRLEDEVTVSEKAWRTPGSRNQPFPPGTSTAMWPSSAWAPPVAKPRPWPETQARRW